MKKNDVVKKGLIDLKDIDVNKRVRAVKALGKYKDPNIVSILIKTLENDKDNLVRIQVIKSLSKNNDEKSASALKSVLEDENDEVRSNAVIFFKNKRLTSDPTLIPTFIRLLENDELESIRKSAASILGDIRTHSAVLPLIKFLEDEDDYSAKYSAIYALGNIENVRAVPALMNILFNDPRLRDIAGLALVQISDIYSIPILIKAMENEDANICNVAVKTLGEMNYREILKALDYALDNYSNNVNWEEAFDSYDDYHQIIKILKPFIWSSGRYMLENIEDPNDISVVTSTFIRQKYAETSSEFKDISITTALIEALENNIDLYVRNEAAKALGRIRETRAVSTLINTLENDKPESFSNFAVETLRSSAAEALGKINDSRAIPSLIYSLENDESESVRNSAAEALRMFKNNETAINTLAKKQI